MQAWRAAFGARPRAEEMDAVLHRERVENRAVLLWRDLPRGTFVAVGGVAHVVLQDRLMPWSAQGYERPVARPARGDAKVLTPASTVAVLARYEPVIRGHGARA
jgi:hypothetical protein